MIIGHTISSKHSHCQFCFSKYRLYTVTWWSWSNQLLIQICLYIWVAAVFFSVNNSTVTLESILSFVSVHQLAYRDTIEAIWSSIRGLEKAYPWWETLYSELRVLYFMVKMCELTVWYLQYVFSRHGMCAQMRWWQLKRCPTMANSLMRWDKIDCFYIVVQHEHFHTTHSLLTSYASSHGHVNVILTVKLLNSSLPDLISVVNEETGVELSNLQNWQFV